MKKRIILIIVFLCLLVIAWFLGYYAKELFSRKLNYKLMTTNEAIEFKIIDYKEIFDNYKDFNNFVKKYDIKSNISKYDEKFFKNYNLIVVSYDSNSFCGNIKLNKVSYIFKTAFIDYTISTKNMYDENNDCILDTTKNRIDYYSVSKNINKIYTTMKKKN